MSTHQFTLSSVKSEIALAKPSKYAHFTRGGKRNYLIEDRFSKIEKGNQKLLNKIKGIISDQHTFSTMSPEMKKYPSMQNTLHSNYRK